MTEHQVNLKLGPMKSVLVSILIVLSPATLLAWGDGHQIVCLIAKERLVFFLDQPRAVNLRFVWDMSILLHRKGTTPILQYALALNDSISPDEATRWAEGTAEDSRLNLGNRA